MPAILDIKWCGHSLLEKAVFGVVNSLGNLYLYDVKLTNDDTDKMVVNKITDISIGQDDENETLALSLDWSTGKYERYYFFVMLILKWRLTINVLLYYVHRCSSFFWSHFSFHITIMPYNYSFHW